MPRGEPMFGPSPLTKFAHSVIRSIEYRLGRLRGKVLGLFHQERNRCRPSALGREPRLLVECGGNVCGECLRVREAVEASLARG